MTEPLFSTAAPVFTVDGRVRGELARDLLRLEIAEEIDGLKTLTARFVAFGPAAGSGEERLLYLEGDALDFGTISVGTEKTLDLELVDQGVRSIALRFAPTVHGMRDHGFVAALTGIARRQGVSAYPGDGTNRWAAVHRSDAARMIALGLTGAPAGSRLHAVAEEGVPSRAIAEAIGAALDVPVRSVEPDDVPAHFGWIGTFFGMDLAATSDATRQLLGRAAG